MIGQAFMHANVEGIVLMIRQDAAELEAFCRQSGNFLPVCDLEFLFKLKNINFLNQFFEVCRQ
jgi:hypothetical protein